MQMTRLIFLDTETTGLFYKNHEIIEFCAIVRNENGTTTHTFKIKPDQIDTANPYALQINGYTPEKWKDAISQKQAAKLISDIVKDGIVVGHNVAFDLKFIYQLMEDQDQDHEIPTASICTQEICRTLQDDLKWSSVSMDNIRRSLGWSMEGAHTAEKDVRDLIKLYDHLKTFISSL